MRSDLLCADDKLDPRLRGDDGAVSARCALGHRRRFDAFDLALNHTK
jgi:hypothetical protein